MKRGCSRGMSHRQLGEIAGKLRGARSQALDASNVIDAPVSLIAPTPAAHPGHRDPRARRTQPVVA